MAPAPFCFPRVRSWSSHLVVIKDATLNAKPDNSKLFLPTTKKQEFLWYNKYIFIDYSDRGTLLQELVAVSRDKINRHARIQKILICQGVRGIILFPKYRRGCWRPIFGKSTICKFYKFEFSRERGRLGSAPPAPPLKMAALICYRPYGQYIIMHVLHVSTSIFT